MNHNIFPLQTMTHTLKYLTAALLLGTALLGAACDNIQATPTPAVPAAGAQGELAPVARANPNAQAAPGADPNYKEEEAPLPKDSPLPAPEPSENKLTPTSRDVAPVAPSPGELAGERQDKPRGPAPQGQKLEFLDFVASHCLVDELVPTEYAQGWEDWVKKSSRSFVPKDSPQPARGSTWIPDPGSERAQNRAEGLREQWAQAPRSHVVDCRADLTPRDCPGCRGKGAQRFSYAAYLPEALIRNPEKVRSILILVPGGNGGRTRYFLTPIPNKTIYHKMSGGLEVKRLVDEHVAAHPDEVPPIVIAVDGAGFLSVNGDTEFLTHDVPLHVAQTYLGRKDLKGLAIGAEGISSGSKAMMFALRAKPDAFHTVGLTCMHCRRFHGIDPDKDLGTKEERQRWLQQLARRSENDLLHIQFSVGNLDNQWGCNKEFHDLFTEVGIFQKEEPRFTDCRKDKTGTSYCDTTWDGFYLFDGQAHHYGLLLDSWEPQLHWHLSTLSKTVATLDGP